MPFGMVSAVAPGTDVLDGVHVPQGEGAVSWIFWHLYPIRLNGWIGKTYCSPRNVFDWCKKLTIFPYGQDIVGNIVLLAFWQYSQVQDRSAV